MPAAAAIAIYFGIGFAEATRRLDGMPARRLPVIFAAGLQFLMLVYSPRNQVPSQADRAAGEKLLERVWNIPGEVYWAPMQAQEMPSSTSCRTVSRRSLASSWRRTSPLRWRVAATARSCSIVGRLRCGHRTSTHMYALVDADLTGGPFYPVTGRDESRHFSSRGARVRSRQVSRRDNCAALGGFLTKFPLELVVRRGVRAIGSLFQPTERPHTAARA